MRNFIFKRWYIIVIAIVAFLIVAANIGLDLPIWVDIVAIGIIGILSPSAASVNAKHYNTDIATGKIIEELEKIN